MIEKRRDHHQSFFGGGLVLYQIFRPTFFADTTPLNLRKKWMENPRKRHLFYNPDSSITYMPTTLSLKGVVVANAEENIKSP